MATIGYVRRSTDKGQRYSISAQKNEILRFAEKNSLNIDSWAIEDAISGKAKVENRPALFEVLTTLRRGDTFIALNVSRLARDEFVFYEVAGTLARRGVELRFADGNDTSNPMNKLLMGILVLVASLERSQIASRTKKGLAVARSRGVALGAPGRVRYGFRSQDGLLAEDESEQKILQEAFKLRSLNYSYRQIATHFEETGRLNRKGNPFTKQAIRQMFVQRSKDEELYDEGLKAAVGVIA